MSSPVIYEIEVLTDLWTGDSRGKAERLVTTGLLGSIRWWFEVVVRGLDGAACDPSNSKSRCPDGQGRRCVACEAFGCTGRARKFRFDVLSADGTPQHDQIKKGCHFRLSFTPLRPVEREEWALLDLTLRLIAEHGAIGGKTVYKPSDEQGRASKPHHQDYGLIYIAKSPGLERLKPEQLRAYVGDQRWRRVTHGEFSWASLTNFWCVRGRYLARQDASRSSFNRVIGRPEPKQKASRGDSWLAGRRAGSGREPESKKVFSFKDPARTFGFAKDNEVNLNDIKSRLRCAWNDLRDEEVRDGDAILKELLREATP